MRDVKDLSSVIQEASKTTPTVDVVSCNTIAMICEIEAREGVQFNYSSLASKVPDTEALGERLAHQLNRLGQNVDPEMCKLILGRFASYITSPAVDIHQNSLMRRCSGLLRYVGIRPKTEI